MSNEIELKNAGDGPPVDRNLPWRLALGGLLAVIIAAAVNFAVEGFPPKLEALGSQTSFTAIIRLVLTVSGMFAAGLAVWFAPSRVGILVLACLTGVIARFGFHPAWDSGIMLAGFGSIAAGVAAVLMAMPQLYRRVGVSLLVLLHFGSILA